MLLQRWHEGDRRALEELLVRHLPFIEAAVRKRRGRALRVQADTQDHVQDVMIRVLEYGPRFVAGADQFRGLMVRIVGNVLCDAHRRGRYRRVEALPRDSVLSLDRSMPEHTRPSESATANEERALMLLATEFLDEERRWLVEQRMYEERSFLEIGTRLGISEDAARKRFNRCLIDMSGIVQRMRNAQLDALLGGDDARGTERAVAAEPT